MKRITIYSAAACLLAACSHGEVYDAAGTFEATEITLSAEAAGRILTLDAELGDRLRANRAVGCIDTLQLSLQRRQLERQRASVATTRPDIAKQAASLREQIAKQRTERQRVENLLRDGAATTKQLDDIDAQLRMLEGQLDALLSTLGKNSASIDENASAIDLQIAQIDDRLAKCRHHTARGRDGAGQIRRSGRGGGCRAAAAEDCRPRPHLPAGLFHLRPARRRAARAGGDGYRRLRRRRTVRLSRTHRMDRIRERIHAQGDPDARFAGPTWFMP